MRSEGICSWKVFWAHSLKISWAHNLTFCSRQVLGLLVTLSEKSDDSLHLSKVPARRNISLKSILMETCSLLADFLCPPQDNSPYGSISCFKNGPMRGENV